MSRTIALLTDFGTSDSYVGVMKAVMQCICPDVRFIDITHDIEPQHIPEAAFTLLNCYRYFEPGTVFLVVVDPGVGGARRPIAAQAGDYWFVAPDNGVLFYILAESENPTVVELQNPAFQLLPVSSTFHGRDIFAPAAAHLAAGVPVTEFGPQIESAHKLRVPQLQITDTQIRGQVIQIDRFGNLITNIGELTWADTDKLTLRPRFGNYAEQSTYDIPKNAQVSIRERALAPIRRTYSETHPGDVLALVGSSGYLEIAINQGNAAAFLNVSLGAKVAVQIG